MLVGLHTIDRWISEVVVEYSSRVRGFNAPLVSKVLVGYCIREGLRREGW